MSHISIFHPEVFSHFTMNDVTQIRKELKFFTDDNAFRKRDTQNAQFAEELETQKKHWISVFSRQSVAPLYGAVSRRLDAIEVDLCIYSYI